MSQELAIVTLFLRTSSLFSIALITLILYLMHKKWGLLFSTSGAMKINAHMGPIKWGIILIIAGFVFFIGCEALEALELLGFIPLWLVEIHHYSEIPQMVFFVGGQLLFLKTALTIDKELE